MVFEKNKEFLFEIMTQKIKLTTYLFVVVADCIEPFKDLPGVLWLNEFINNIKVLFILHVLKSTSTELQLTPSDINASFSL